MARVRHRPNASRYARSGTGPGAGPRYSVGADAAHVPDQVDDQDEQDGQDAELEPRVVQLPGHDPPGVVGEDEDEVQQAADDQDGRPEADQPRLDPPDPVPVAEQRAGRLGDDRLLRLDELQELQRPLDAAGAGVQAVERPARVEQRQPLLTRQAANEAPDVVLQVVLDGERMTKRAERDQHLEVADDAGRHRELLDADRVEDVDRQLRIRVLRMAGGAGRLDRHPQPVRDRVVQERLVDADQLPASGGDVRRRARCEPAHELQDGGLDLAPEEQPAVAGQRVPDAIGQLADDPEVDVADRVARQDEQVGRVQVGVEVAEHVDLVEHVPVEVADDPVEVVAAGGKRLEVRGVALALGDHDLDQRDADDQLGGQDARRRVVAVDAGDPLDLVALRVLVEEDGLPRLDQVVELVGGPARELVDHLPAAGRPEDVAPVEDPGRRVHQGDVRGRASCGCPAAGP